MSDKTYSESERMLAHILGLVGVLAIEPRVIATLWRWYLEPMGAPHLGVLRAFGLNLVVGVLTYRYIERDEDERAAAAVSTFAAAPLALAFGWCALKLFGG